MGIARNGQSRWASVRGSEQSALAVQRSDLLYSAMRLSRTTLAVCWWATRSTASARHLRGNAGRIVPAHPTQCVVGAEVRSLTNLPLPPIGGGPFHPLFEIFPYLYPFDRCGSDVAFPPAKPHSSTAPPTDPI